MAEQITASFEALQHDGSNVANGYLKAAVEAVDAQFGDGFARKNPADAAPIIAAYMAAAMACYTTVSRAKVDEGIAVAICGSLDSVAAAINEIAIEMRQNAAS